MTNKVVLKKGDKMYVGKSTKVFKLLKIKTPETIRRWLRRNKKEGTHKPIEKNGFEVFTDVTEL